MFQCKVETTLPNFTNIIIFPKNVQQGQLLWQMWYLGRNVEIFWLHWWLMTASVTLENYLSRIWHESWGSVLNKTPNLISCFQKWLLRLGKCSVLLSQSPFCHFLQHRLGFVCLIEQIRWKPFAPCFLPAHQNDMNIKTVSLCRTSMEDVDNSL